MEMFIIVPPLNRWDHPSEDILLRAGRATLSFSAGAAWRIHTRDDMSKVQAWFDRGYRVRRVAIALEPEKEA